jgi:ABC-type multidrug transport system ATPase subunit
MIPRLRVDGLNKSYGAIPALQDVALEIHDGEVLGLIGPNGAGKTTLFECVAGVLPADAGRVDIDGRGVDSSTRGRHLFYMPDGIAPWPSERVGWAIDFALGFFGGPIGRRRDIVNRLGLAPLLDRRIGALSRGERKRALLGIALLTPQPLLLADEPFDGLDLRQTRDIGAALREHAAAGRTLFLSIHQIPDAARICDRFVLLSGGRVRAQGAKDELTELARATGSAARDLEEVVLALT